MPTYTLSDIQIRDPFVLPVAAEGRYYLFGTTDADAWKGSGQGFNCYHSQDLVNWEGPLAAFRPGPDFWATTNFWAPEAHFFAGRYYLFASFKASQRYRGTQILAADMPAGPYKPLTDGPITPPNWECLDGTLHVDERGQPWIVFCHEWVQIHNGAIAAMPLSDDLRAPAGRPVFLFNASEAAWSGTGAWPSPELNLRFPTYVTDGPFLHRMASGNLVMLWSTLGAKGYTMGQARSLSGHITGPWVQSEQPLWEQDGGHGMIFRAFDGQLYVTLHRPNNSPFERAHFYPVQEAGDWLALA